MKIDKDFLKKRPILTSVMIFIVIAACILLILRLTRKNIGDLTDDSNSLYNFQRSTSNLSQREVILYFVSDEDSFLHPEKRLIFDTEFVTDQAKQIIVELIKGPRTDLKRTIPEGTRLRELFLDNYGTAYIDFTSEISTNLRGGSETELLLIYSIVNTLTENFSQFKTVRFLVDGREIESLNGHIDMGVSFINKAEYIFNPETAQQTMSQSDSGETDNE